MYYFGLKLADIYIPIAAVYAATSKLFGSYTIDKNNASENVQVLPDAKDFWLDTGKPLDAVAEYSMLSVYCSDYLLSHNRCVFHAVAFSHKDRAYLITAPPGVGKTTQMMFLQKLYPGEFHVISGDRPILERLQDNSFIVHPSPWNGKENWYGAGAKPLAGIICLERGKDNKLEQYNPKDAVLPLLPALLCSCESQDLIVRMASFEDALLRMVPVWHMINGGVPDSTDLLYRSLFMG